MGTQRKECRQRTERSKLGVRRAKLHIVVCVLGIASAPTIPPAHQFIRHECGVAPNESASAFPEIDGMDLYGRPHRGQQGSPSTSACVGCACLRVSSCPLVSY